MLGENVVSAATDDNTAFAVGNIADDFRLVVEKVVVRGEVVTFRGNQLLAKGAVVALEEGSLACLVRLFKQVDIDAAFLRGKLHNFAVIEFDAKALCQHFADGAAAAAEAACDGYGKVFHQKSPPQRVM